MREALRMIGIVGKRHDKIALLVCVCFSKRLVRNLLRSFANKFSSSLRLGNKALKVKRAAPAADHAEQIRRCSNCIHETENALATQISQVTSDQRHVIASDQPTLKSTEAS